MSPLSYRVTARSLHSISAEPICKFALHRHAISLLFSTLLLTCLQARVPSRIAWKQNLHFKAAEVPRFRGPQDGGGNGVIRCAPVYLNYDTLSLKFKTHLVISETATSRLSTWPPVKSNTQRDARRFPLQITLPTLSMLSLSQTRNHRDPRLNQTPSVSNRPQYHWVLPSRSPLSKQH